MLNNNSDLRSEQVAENAIVLTKENFSALTREVPILARRALRMLMGAKRGQLAITIPSGKTFRIDGVENGIKAELTMENWGIAKRTLASNSIGTGESYMLGEWTSENPTQFLQYCLQNWGALPMHKRGSFFKLLNKVRHAFNANSKRGSRKNIAAHYDLGNDFYELWLDESMTYSSALFSQSATSLKDAQTNKYAQLAKSLCINEQSEVLEIGCGWGGFAEYVGREIGASMTCLTISQEQFDYAKKRIFDAGLNEKVDIVFRDYRDEKGRYDAIGSIEMIEAVGEEYWPSYFGQIGQCLNSGGKAGIQAICIDDDQFELYRKAPDFIQRYIFPGGMLVPPKMLGELPQKFGLVLQDQLIFGHDYADTLKIWRERFFDAWPKIEKLGFDERFMRMWEFYLVYCEAGFREERIDVRQVIFEKP